MRRAGADGVSMDDQRLLETFRLTRLVAVQWTIVSTIGLVLCASVFGAMYTLLTGASLQPITVTVSTPLEMATTIAVVAAVVGIVVLVHELIHGVCMGRYGTRAEYGVGIAYFVLPYAYARSEGANYTRNQMLVVLLAPLVVISLGGLLALVVTDSTLVLVVLAANAAGSIGDCWMAALLLQYSSSVRVTELPDGRAGFGVYGSPAERAIRLESANAVATFLYGSVGTFGTIVVTLFVAVLGSLAFGSGNLVIGDPDRLWFLFQHELHPNGPGATVEVGVPLALTVSSIGGLVAVLGSSVRRRLEES
ncbi:DUF3267 domain-containing protein [Halobacteria archaeon AArc-m2/3/4]|uniref:DUF3267 domain-containing protein n=1 Tax=Natronoglomus mannanivorans TaxID=2979990 RepID=A0ABT2QES1_9EURY|nr:DUF3267 domain-containing protein [Halobacteria archaeon AArc-m2/3/4]